MLKSINDIMNSLISIERKNMPDKIRCDWCNSSKLYQDYHDNEWGVPVHDDDKHFEFLLLETMQAGLSWITILKRREGYRSAFANFDPNIVQHYDSVKVLELMQNTNIIRNRQKILAAINNAKRFLEIQQSVGSFDHYIWSFTNEEIINNSWNSITKIPVTSILSDTISKDLKKRGFKFVGSITIYAHLQAIGVINDHLDSCWRSNCNK